MWPFGSRNNPKYWLDPEDADEGGLVGVGGDLEPSTMIRAYSEGVFAWFNEGDPILWWSPNPRAIFEFNDIHISRRLQRTIRSGKFRITIDTAFNQVVNGCARAEGTWITDSMKVMYDRLHELGVAHSVEAWVGDTLAGGIFGIAIGGFFAGESMFHSLTDGSKVAFVGLVEQLRKQGYELFDTQMRTEHTTTLGAIDIPREHYLRRLGKVIGKKGVRFL